MKILTIAKNTLREAIRDKILYIISIFALGMMAFSTLLYHLSMQQDVKIMKDLGLGMISVFGIIITIFIGSSMLFKEIDKKTIYTVLSKPVNRSTFLIGKFIGLALVLLIITISLTIAFYLILKLRDVTFEPIFILAITFSYLEMLFLTAVTIFFSTLTSPIITTFSTLVILLVGRSTEAIYTAIQKIDQGVIQTILKGMFYLIPNLSYTRVINQVVYGTTLGFYDIALIIGYILFYTFFLMFLSSLTFKNKDF